MGKRYARFLADTGARGNRRTDVEDDMERLHILAIAAIAIDIALGRRQSMAIMNVVWPVTALYFGPVAVWYYFTWARAGQRRKDFAFWHQAAVGTTHCGAGCAIGDIAGEWIAYAAPLPVYGIDFGMAYLTGIVFQYFAIAPMRGISGWEGVKAAMRADTVSLIAFEIGMFAWMAYSHSLVHAPPHEPVYWFMMQIAMIAGYFTSFPANWWLIRKGWKEAM